MSVRCIYLSGMHLLNQELPSETLKLKLAKIFFKLFLIDTLILSEDLVMATLITVVLAEARADTALTHGPPNPK